MILENNFNIKQFIDAYVNDFLSMSNEDILKENNGKKFDIVLMNPPYDRSLHLKFLEKVIKISEKTVSIQPVRWLEDPFAKYKNNSDYKKYNNSIYKHIKSLEKIDKKQASTYFNISLVMNIGIYVCDENGGYNNDNNTLVNKIVEKTINNSWDQFNCKKMKDKPLKKYILRTTGITGGKNPLMCATYERQLQVKAPNPNSHNANNCAIFSFDTEKERRNFYDCYNSDFMKWHCSLWKSDINSNTKNIPYFNNYTKHWTNEMFYKYFDLTQDEINKVEQYINNIK